VAPPRTRLRMAQAHIHTHCMRAPVHQHLLPQGRCASVHRAPPPSGASPVHEPPRAHARMQTHARTGDSLPVTSMSVFQIMRAEVMMRPGGGGLGVALVGGRVGVGACACACMRACTDAGSAALLHRLLASLTQLHALHEQLPHVHALDGAHGLLYPFPRKARQQAYESFHPGSSSRCKGPQQELSFPEVGYALVKCFACTHIQPCGVAPALLGSAAKPRAPLGGMQPRRPTAARARARPPWAAAQWRHTHRTPLPRALWQSTWDSSTTAHASLECGRPWCVASVGARGCAWGCAQQHMHSRAASSA